jgi:penicillin G amidase
LNRKRPFIIEKSRQAVAFLGAACVALLPYPVCAEKTASGVPTAVSMTVAGLERPAEIIVDRYGVPHLYAGTHYDAFFLQGFNAARDRLWQIDLWRRRGLGQLSEVFGPAYLEQDRAARLFLYRGDMYREWLAYGSDAKRIAESFVAGINAWIDQTAQQPDLLPPEFQQLNYRPSTWAAEDVVRIRSHGLLRNVVQEVQRAQLVCAGGLELAADWKKLEPPWQTAVPEGLDPCVVPADVLNDYLLATAPVTFKSAVETVSIAATMALENDTGSNNWVVAPSRTTTGRPILANDPHRAHAVPSLRYVAHLIAPDLNVIGAGEPALPGISIGHNERIAFGLTIFPIDQEDLYFYRREKNGYRYADHVEPIREVTDTIKVRGGTNAQVVYRFTRHGPIVREDKQRIWAVRAGWLEPGMSPYFGSVEYMRANNWRQFSSALNRWGAPSENQVYADIDGNIGYKAAGLTPIRNTWDGLLPIPGDGRHEWAGFADMDALPTEFNPDRGFTGTANSMNLPADFDIDRYRLGFEWSAPWRYKRLWQSLTADSRHSPADSAALQRDYHELLADEVLRRLPDLAQSGEAGAMLADWDRVLTRDSAAGALWAIWFYETLTPAVATAIGGQQAHLLAPLDPLTVLNVLDGAKPEINVRDLVNRSLSSAWLSARNQLGDDPSTWRWGKLHQIRFAHPLLPRLDAANQKRFGMPVLERGGSGNTVNSTSFSGNDFQVRAGASWRMVLDVGNWNAARMTNAPGQSGDPRSPFYANLLEGWANDLDFPLLWSRAQIDAEKVMSIELVPDH